MPSSKRKATSAPAPSPVARAASRARRRCPGWTGEEEAALSKLMSSGEKMTVPLLLRSLERAVSRAQAVMQHWKSLNGGEATKKVTPVKSTSTKSPASTRSSKSPPAPKSPASPKTSPACRCCNYRRCVVLLAHHGRRAGRCRAGCWGLVFDALKHALITRHSTQLGRRLCAGSVCALAQYGQGTQVPVAVGDSRPLAWAQALAGLAGPVFSYRRKERLRAAVYVLQFLPQKIHFIYDGGRARAAPAARPPAAGRAPCACRRRLSRVSVCGCACPSFHRRVALLLLCPAAPRAHPGPGAAAGRRPAAGAPKPYATHDATAYTEYAPARVTVC